MFQIPFPINPDLRVTAGILFMLWMAALINSLVFYSWLHKALAAPTSQRSSLPLPQSSCLNQLIIFQYDVQNKYSCDTTILTNSQVMCCIFSAVNSPFCFIRNSLMLRAEEIYEALCCIWFCSGKEWALVHLVLIIRVYFILTSIAALNQNKAGKGQS